ncbi:DUF4872 domain-containing protein [candidate division KSB1 bacterium]|nr:DUF4872 domain-containing protein [candidate division KSB1 bacterium]
MKLEQFEHKMGQHHEFSCLRDIFTYYKHPFSEALIFGLEGAFGFRFNESIAISKAHPLPYFIDGCIAHFAGNACRHLGIQMQKCAPSSPQKAWEEVKALIDRGEPVILWVDIKKLLPDYPLKSSFEFGQFSIIVVGYDQSNAYFVTHDAPKPHTISINQLKEAGCSSTTVFPAKNTSFQFSRHAEAVALEWLVRTSLQRTAHQFLTPQVSTQGKEGLERFAYELPHIPRKLFGKEKQIDASSGNSLLRRQFELFSFFIDDLNGGMTRNLFACLLEEAGHILEQPEIVALSCNFRQSAALWQAFANGLRQVPIDSIQHAETKLQELVRIQVSILEIEIEAFSKLLTLTKRSSRIATDSDFNFNQPLYDSHSVPEAVQQLSQKSQIRLRNCCVNNLRSINLEIEKNQLIVVAGRLGSGKSSLVIDLLAKHSRERYHPVSCQEDIFAELATTGDVIGIPPVVEFTIHSMQRCACDTKVGELSNIFHYLGRFMMELGIAYCPICGEKFDGAWRCPGCFYSVEPVDLSSFSWKNRRGRCPQCQGKGLIQRIDEEKVIYNSDLSLDDLLKNNQSAVMAKIMLSALSEQFDFDLELPLKQYPPGLQQLILHGTNELVELEIGVDANPFKKKMKYPGIIPAIISTYAETDCTSRKTEIESFMTEEICPVCSGLGLRPEVLSMRIGDLGIADFLKMPCADLNEYFLCCKFPDALPEIARVYLEELQTRLWYLNEFGSGHLNLIRNLGSLSFSEYQDCKLCDVLAARSTGLMYIFDHPTTGHHHKHHLQLIAAFQKLRDFGNTVIIIDHEPLLLKAANVIIDLEPESGTGEGTIVATGDYANIRSHPTSSTGAYLNHQLHLPSRQIRPPSPGECISIWGARARNLKNIDVQFPLRRLSCVTGVAGAGKSSLVMETLVPAVKRFLENKHVSGANFRDIHGLDRIEYLAVLNLEPIRADVSYLLCEYLGIWELICRIFSSLSVAIEKGFTEKYFHLKYQPSACPACEGTGLLKTNSHSNLELNLPCPECRGKRFKKDVLDIQFKNHTISDLLNLSVEDGFTLFENQPSICRKLAALNEVGVGYLKLGQPIKSLSLIECQRIKLAQELVKHDSGNALFVFEEPASGLHFSDLSLLLTLFSEMLEKGNTIVSIETNLEMIERADLIIDLGPEGGDEGGYLLVQNTPEECARCAESLTGYYLRRG